MQVAGDTNADSSAALEAAYTHSTDMFCEAGSFDEVAVFLKLAVYA